MTHMNYKEQGRSRLYDGPNPIRMGDRAWRLMITGLPPEQRRDLTELREQARDTSRLAIASPVSSSEAFEKAEQAMTSLLEKLSELNVRQPAEGLVLVGSAV